MSQSLGTALLNLLDNAALSDGEIRHLIGWSALSLADLLRRKCISVRYAEQTFFNLSVVQKLEQRHLEDCVEVLEWGMQLEDWEEHTPEELPEALATITRLAQRLLVATTPTLPSSPKPRRSQVEQQKGVKRRSHYA